MPSAVVCSASADPDDELAAAAPDGVQDHFPDSVGGGGERIFLGIRDQSDTGGAGHLDDRGFLIRDVSVVCRYRSSHGSGHF